LIGSLFSVNDISGLPVLEVFSDDTINFGSYLSQGLLTTKKKTFSATGTTSIYNIVQSTYDGAFLDYIVKGTTGVRSGTVMAVWSGSTANYTDSSTNDIGNTNDVSFTVTATGTTASFNVVIGSTGWAIKTILRAI